MDGTDFDTGDLTRAFTAALANGAAGKPSASLDLAAFVDKIDAVDASDAEKLELLMVIENIMAAWVDMGFGLNPVQLACGKVAEIGCDSAQEDSEVLDSKHAERTNE